MHSLARCQAIVLAALPSGSPCTRGWSCCVPRASTGSNPRPAGALNRRLGFRIADGGWLDSRSCSSARLASISPLVATQIAFLQRRESSLWPGPQLQRRVSVGQLVSGLVQLHRMIVSRHLLARILKMDCQRDAPSGTFALKWVERVRVIARNAQRIRPPMPQVRSTRHSVSARKALCLKSTKTGTKSACATKVKAS